MNLGFDFDNTIVRYDALFHRVAREQGHIVASVPLNKNAVRDALRSAGKEDAWTQMQGYVYGARMQEAEAFAGAVEVLRRLRDDGHALYIISHKTRTPYLGPAYDLHTSAQDWIRTHLTDTRGQPLIAPDHVFFHEKKEEKIARIGALRCQVFLDDLPEILLHEAFPAGVARFLISSEPGHQHADYTTVENWRAFAASMNPVTKMRPPMPKTAAVSASAETAAIAALLGIVPDAVLPCAKGGNNRVLRVEAGAKTYAAKYYFQSAQDTRNRLESEWAFLEYAEDVQVPCVPRPVARDAAIGLAIYTFMEGSVPLPEEMNVDAAAQAGRFIANLNRNRNTPAAKALPVASESCFTAANHLALLRARLDKLAAGEALSEYAGAFNVIRESMDKAFAHYAQALEKNTGSDQPLPESQCWISPSDFGFHNTLRTVDGTFSFLDFEHAGWDDPAKLLCDFLLHPALTVDVSLLPALLAPLKAVDLELVSVISRARLLFPLLALRWCCIILNVFVPEFAARRAFADTGWDRRVAQGEQLDKARRMLDRLASNPF